LGGVVGRGITSGLSRVLNPQTSKAARTLLDQDVTPTPGQILGGTARKIEESAKSIPFVGDAISQSEVRANQEFNRAAINKVLEPLGKKTKGFGQEAIGHARKLISQTYDDVLDKLKPIKADNEFATALSNISNMSKSMTAAKQKQLNRIIETELTGKITKDGLMSPTTFKSIDSQLGRLAPNFRNSVDGDQRLLGDALLEVKSQLGKLAARTNPAHKVALNKANEAYAGLLRIENAAARNPTTDGVFSPAQLGMASKAMDNTLRKSATSRGEALMQDFASDGRDVLGANLPDSGTANRLLNALMLGGGYAVNPAIPVAAVGARAAYTAPAQKALAAALAKRTGGTRLAGEVVGKLNPLSAILGATSQTAQ